MKVVCPAKGCSFEVDEGDAAAQVQHMETNHRDIVYKRLVSAGLWDWRHARPVFAKKNDPMNGYKPDGE